MQEFEFVDNGVFEKDGGDKTREATEEERVILQCKLGG